MPEPDARSLYTPPRPPGRTSSAVPWILRARRVWNWGLPALLVATAVALNPQEAQHRLALREALASGHPVGAIFAASERAAPPVQYESYGLLSVTRHGRDLTTVGAFGRVVAVGKRGRQP